MQSKRVKYNPKIELLIISKKLVAYLCKITLQ